MEFDGVLTAVMQQQMAGMRRDKICFRGQQEFDRQRQRSLLKLLNLLISMPFELNKKCSTGMCLQATGTVQLAYYSPQNTFYRKHLDGGYDDPQAPMLNADNGRKITLIYYPGGPGYDDAATTTDNGAEEEGRCGEFKQDPSGYLRMYAPRERNGSVEAGEEAAQQEEAKKEESRILADIAPRCDRLVLLSSRDMPHEVLCNFKHKRFAVSMYLPGPPTPLISKKKSS
jgi:hypothetical protein